MWHWVVSQLQDQMSMIQWWDSNFLRMSSLTPGFNNNRFSHPQSPEANHAGWLDISAEVDLNVANCYSLAAKISDFIYFPNHNRSVKGLPIYVKSVHEEKLKTPDLSQPPVFGVKEIPRTGQVLLNQSNPITSLIVFCASNSCMFKPYDGYLGVSFKT